MFAISSSFTNFYSDFKGEKLKNPLEELPIFFANFRFSHQFDTFFSEFTGYNIKKFLLARCARSQYGGITYFLLKFSLSPSILQSFPIEFKVKNSKNFRSLAKIFLVEVIPCAPPRKNFLATPLVSRFFKQVRKIYTHSPIFWIFYENLTGFPYFSKISKNLFSFASLANF